MKQKLGEKLVTCLSSVVYMKNDWFIISLFSQKVRFFERFINNR